MEYQIWKSVDKRIEKIDAMVVTFKYLDGKLDGVLADKDWLDYYRKREAQAKELRKAIREFAKFLGWKVVLADYDMFSYVLCYDRMCRQVAEAKGALHGNPLFDLEAL